MTPQSTLKASPQSDINLGASRTSRAGKKQNRSGRWRGLTVRRGGSSLDRVDLAPEGLQRILHAHTCTQMVARASHHRCLTRPVMLIMKAASIAEPHPSVLVFLSHKNRAEPDAALLQAASRRQQTPESGQDQHQDRD
ncbi:hypothetical protein FQA47_007980 [Oryzias melastigma]|uniref:Uncharacterized protein n=1 Tax=Oryzias melastigma TaxID=30732 RepID=A0A834FFI9_ORYME|nr:hypothetical protein FQA47_007980 [Oryzias melastigma]